VLEFRVNNEAQYLKIIVPNFEKVTINKNYCANYSSKTMLERRALGLERGRSRSGPRARAVALGR